MHSPDLIKQNIEKIRALFPGCVTEAQGSDGKLKLAIDFDQLKQELSDSIVEGPQERYRLDWPGKRKALLTANVPIAKTLRPCRKESEDFDTTQNLFIEGDNLDALKLLQETYLGKVKMIYIDPPYNTGNDFIYEDDFAEDSDSFLKRSNQKDSDNNRLTANTESNGRFHSDWLSMMFSRIKLARNILTNDGCIFISIDERECSNIRKVLDEVFGEQNFVADIVWQKKTSPDARMNISSAHDHILVYAKNCEKFVFEYLPLEESRRKNFSNPDNDPRGDWASVDITGQTGRAPKSQFYEIETPSGITMRPPEGRCWAMAEATFKELVSDNRIWFGANGLNRPRLKKFLAESKGIRPWTWWDNKSVGHNQESSQELKELFDGKIIFDNPKPVRLIQRIVHLTTKNDDIVMDFFAGSSTTAHAVFKQNSIDGYCRKVVLCQLDQKIDTGTNDFKSSSTALKFGFSNISNISKERICRAGKKILEGECNENWNKDVGFRVLKIDTSNMSDIYYSPDQISQGNLDLLVNNIKEDRSEEDLLFQVLLDWGVDLTLPIRKETICHKTVFVVDDKALLACFDKVVTEDVIKAMAERKPLRVVFRDDGFASDAMKINAEQIFKQLSPGTDVKPI